MHILAIRRNEKGQFLEGRPKHKIKRNCLKGRAVKCL